jgi:endonuclease YncB( thermonuclease family)
LVRQFGWAAAFVIVASLIFVSMILAPVPAQAQAQAQSGKACQHEPLGTGRVAAVKDGRTLVLDDGREVRLAGIEAPSTDSGPGRAAIDALTAWAGGQSVRLSRTGAERDRYGRVLAHAVVDGASQSLQQRLLAEGHARVTSRGACTAESLVFERQARTANLGLWADPYYQMKHAEHAADVLAHRGRFAVVEGTVLSVRESGGTIYVNFGRRWSEDFTATIPKRSERAFVAAGLEPKGLERRRVRVRGWIEERGGPWIDVVGPEQIEIAERK